MIAVVPSSHTDFKAVDFSEPRKHDCIQLERRLLWNQLHPLEGNKMRNLAFGLLLVLLLATLNHALETCETQPSFSQKADGPIADMTMKLARKIATERPQDNLVYSPVSTALTLALLERGAAGQTQRTLQTFLTEANGVKADAHRAFESLQAQLKSDHVKVNLTIANGLFYDQGITVKREYLDKAKCFEAEVRKVNFGSKEETRRQINSWVSEKTNEQIPELLSSDAIQANTQAVLVNALYLKAAWKDEFRLAGNKDFYQLGSATDKKEVPFMRRTGQYVHYSQPTYDVIKIPYVQEKLAMLIALPKERDGLASVFQSLLSSGDSLMLRAGNQTKLVDVQLPKFTIRTKLNLTPKLREIGLGEVFAQGADFGGMTNQAIGFDQVLQEAYVKIDEHGTEAAAATAAAANRRVPRPPSGTPIQFVADHPFLFFILHLETDAELFVGRVNSF